MIILRIAGKTGSDRFVELLPGSHVIGADLGCGVVLLDDGIEARHFALHVAETGVSVEMLADGTGASLHQLGAGAAPLAVGHRVPMAPKDRLIVGAVTLEFRASGLSAETAATTGKARGKMAVAVRRIITVGCVTIAVVAGVSVSVSLKVAPSSALAREMATPDPAPDKRPVAETHQTVLAALSATGFAPVDLRREGTVWRATFHLQDAADRPLLQQAIAQLPHRVEAQILVDAELLQAATLVLESIESPAKAISVTQGRLHLDGLNDDSAAREKLVAQLVMDVPGLRGTSFAEQAGPNIGDLGDQIVGLWLGDRPYVALGDGSTVKVGQQIRDGVALMGIRPNAVLIQQNGIITELKVFK